METFVWSDGMSRRETTAIWHWDNTVFQSEDARLSLADKHGVASQPESDNSVMIGAASAVAGFAVTMFALTRFGKAARAARNDNEFMRA